jgi:type II secretory pathway pseudopilin PulG
MGVKTDVAKGIGWGWLLLIVVIVIAIVTSAGIWFFGVATSNAKGAGDAQKINNSAENRIQKQEKFEKLYQAVKDNKALVELKKKDLADDPTNLTLKQTLAGVQSACVKSVGAYNAEVDKQTSKDWKSADLPDSLSNADCN